MNEIIIKLRKHLGLTQKAFAEKISTTRGALAQIEAGNNKLSFELQHRIKEIFNVNLDNVEIINGYLYNKVSKELLVINDKMASDVSKAENYISENDLSVINREYGHYPEIDIIKTYLYFSERRLKNLLLISKYNLLDKLSLNNKICDIAEILLLTKDSYYKHRFEKISEKDLLENIIQNDSHHSIFDNVKLKWITQIHHFESQSEHMTRIGNYMMDYLNSGIDQNLSVGFMKINKDLINDIHDKE